MNIKRHYTTVILLAIITALVIFGLKNILPRELYVGLSVLMAMLLVISYSVLDIIGFFTNKEWILEEKMWLHKIGKPDTPSLILAQCIWFLPFFTFPTFWGRVTASHDFSNSNPEQASFFLFIYMLFAIILSLFTAEMVGLYRFFSLFKHDRISSMNFKEHEEILKFIKNKKDYKLRFSYYFFALALLISLHSVLRYILENLHDIFFPFTLNDTGLVSRFILYIWYPFLPLAFIVTCFIFFNYYCHQKIFIGLTFATSGNEDKNVIDEVMQSKKELRLGAALSGIFGLISLSILLYLSYFAVIANKNL